MNNTTDTKLTVTTDIVEEPTVWATVADCAQEAGLHRESILAVKVLEFDGPGGGNPEIEITFASRDVALRFFITFCGGWQQALETIELGSI